jgi:hypothetical protein
MLQNINQTSTDINRRKVLVTTSSKTLQKLQKSVEDATIDRDKGTKEKERLVAEFKEIESKAFVTQEKYTHLQEVSFVSVPLKLLLGYINNLLYDITNGLFFIKQWTDAHVKTCFPDLRCIWQSLNPLFTTSPCSLLNTC